ncbi:MAG: hypothetical protein RL213_1068 [Bacteroidota bacterium]|jgi:hypothetical protein
MKRTALLFLLVASLSSCSKFHTGTVRSTDIYGPGVLQKPVVAELSVNETRVQGTFSGRKSKGLENLKQLAMLDAINKSKADVLVEPTFDVSTVGRKVTVNVSGFPATYTNFHSIKTDEVDLFKAGALKKAAVYTKDEPRKGRPGRTAAISVGSGVAFLLLLLALL